MVINFLETCMELANEYAFLTAIFILEVIAFVVMPFLPITSGMIADFGYIQYVGSVLFLQVPIVIALGVIAVCWKLIDNR